MSDLLKLLLAFTTFTLFAFSAFARSPATATFLNPVLKTPGSSNRADNLLTDRFSREVSVAKRLKSCFAISNIADKLNMDDGLRATVYVGTAAPAEVAGNFRPFGYTVKFENYRQSKNEVRILDDEITAQNFSGR